MVLHNWIERTDQLFVASYKIFFFIVGTFGNLSFIYLVIRFRQLRSKSSYLQCIQCFVHVICLLGTMVDVALAFPDVQLGRDECFHVMVPFVFFEAAQTVLMLELVVDILIIVQFPGFYKIVDTWKYLLAAFPLPILFGSVFAIWGFTDLDDEEIYFCSPTAALHTKASMNYTRVIVITNTITVAVFALLIFTFHQKAKNENAESSKVMKRLQLSVAIFLGSWYITIFTYYICIAVGVTGEDLHFTINNLSFFVCLAYSQTFYVILWKSSEYRKVFFDLLASSRTTRETTKMSSSRVAVLLHSPTLI